MTVFYIVCHGETLFSKKGLMQGWCDSPLTNDAIEQTFALSNELKSIHFDGLYTSPSGRALKTASIIGSQIGQTPISVEALKEVSYGYLEGNPRKIALWMERKECAASHVFLEKTSTPLSTALFERCKRSQENTQIKIFS